MEQLINDIQSIYNRIKNSENVPQIEKDLLKKKIMELYEAAIGMDNKVTFESITGEGTIEVENPPVDPEISAYDILEEEKEAFVTLEMEEAEKEMFDDEELFDEEPAVGDITYTPPMEDEQKAASEEIVQEPIAEKQEEVEEPIPDVVEPPKVEVPQPEEEKVEETPIEEPAPEPVAEIPAEPVQEPEPAMEEQKEEPVVEASEEKSEEKVEEQPVAETPIEEPIEETEQPVAETPKEEEEAPRIIEQLSLNDMAAEGNSNDDLAKKFTEAPIEDLLKTIPVYKRYEFIAELFNNEQEGFDKAVKDINNSPSADAAFEYVHDTLKPKYNWDEDNELVMDFVAFVRRRFTR